MIGPSQVHPRSQTRSQSQSQIQSLKMDQRGAINLSLKMVIMANAQSMDAKSKKEEAATTPNQVEVLNNSGAS